MKWIAVIHICIAATCQPIEYGMEPQPTREACRAFLKAEVIDDFLGLGFGVMTLCKEVKR
jgi:hypothetical protein